MDERETLLREICGEDANAFVETRERAINTVPLFPLRQILPDVVERLKHLLTEDGKLELAASVEGLFGHRFSRRRESRSVSCRPRKHPRRHAAQRQGRSSCWTLFQMVA